MPYSPLGDVYSPMGAVHSPMGAMYSPMGAVRSPIGAVSSPVGAVSSPVGVAQSPVGLPQLLMKLGLACSAEAVGSPARADGGGTMPIPKGGDYVRHQVVTSTRYIVLGIKACTSLKCTAHT